MFKFQVCLGIKGRVKVLEDIFDLPQQNLIRQDCKTLVEKLDNSSSEKLSILSDLESIITNFSRLYNCPYDSSNGWIELLGTLIHLNAKRDELFKIFESIQLRYVNRFYNFNCEESSLLYLQPFHLLRLLLLYHDPELCNFFDSLKLTPEHYASKWVCTVIFMHTLNCHLLFFVNSQFRSLFCSLCDDSVSLVLLDSYLTYANPFLIFFLSLVMTINLKSVSFTSVDH